MVPPLYEDICACLVPEWQDGGAWRREGTTPTAEAIYAAWRHPFVLGGEEVRIVQHSRKYTV